ncbi:MAG: YbaK/EbsC family protein [Kineosporiaceae bacterium]
MTIDPPTDSASGGRGPASPTASCPPAVEPAPDPLLAHPSVAAVRTALADAGAQGAVRVLDGHARTAAQAAQFLGIEIAQIANSLVFAVPAGEGAPGEGEAVPLLVMTSGAHRVDTARLAATLGVGRLDRADADFVRHHTGFAIGGSLPSDTRDPAHAHRRRPRPHSVIWAAAGHPRTVFPTTFDELVRITGGEVVEVA